MKCPKCQTVFRVRKPAPKPAAPAPPSPPSPPSPAPVEAAPPPPPSPPAPRIKLKKPEKGEGGMSQILHRELPKVQQDADGPVRFIWTTDSVEEPAIVLESTGEATVQERVVVVRVKDDPVMIPEKSGEITVVAEVPDAGDKTFNTVYRFRGNRTATFYRDPGTSGGGEVEVDHQFDIKNLPDLSAASQNLWGTKEHIKIKIIEDKESVNGEAPSQRNAEHYLII